MGQNGVNYYEQILIGQKTHNSQEELRMAEKLLAAATIKNTLIGYERSIRLRRESGAHHKE